MIRDCEEFEGGKDILRSYARRLHCGLVLNGGFAARQTPDTQTVISYDVLGDMNAGNFLARRSLEDMRATEGQYQGYRVMLPAAMDGATPSEGPWNKTTLEQLHERQWDLLGKGLQDQIKLKKKWRSIKSC